MSLLSEYTNLSSIVGDEDCLQRTGGCEFESQPSHTKDLKNGNRYTQQSAKFESDIDKPERLLSNGQMFLCPNGELNALGPPTQDPH